MCANSNQGEYVSQIRVGRLGCQTLESAKEIFCWGPAAVVCCSEDGHMYPSRAKVIIPGKWWKIHPERLSFR